MGINTDPSQDLFLAMSRNYGDNVQRAAMQFATEQNAQNLIDYSTFNPLGSANLGLGTTIAGIPGSSAGVSELVQQELAVSPTLGPIETPGEGWWNELAGVWDEWVDNPIKGTTRFGFGLWDAGYQMFAGGAPVRANQQARQQGTSFGEAWQDQDPYIFEAIGAMFNNEQVNLGSGWFPNSEVAPELRDTVNTEMMEIERQTEHLPTNEKYAARLQASPDVWNTAVANSAEQAALGMPLTQLAHAQAEGIMFDVNQFGGGSVKTPWSPGRVAAATMMEPGTEGFARVSGMGDIATQLFADPAEWVGLGWAKWGIKGRLLFSQADKVAKHAVREMPNPATGGFVQDEALLTSRIPLKDETGAALEGKPTPAPDDFYGLPDELPGTTPTTDTGEAVGLFDIDDVPVDPTMVLANDMGIKTGDMGDQLDMLDEFGLPDWTNPDRMGRSTGPVDPPDWYRDHVNQILEFTKRIKTNQKAVMVEKGFWTISDESGNPIHIFRNEAGKWDVTTETGELISSGHRSKNVAVDSAKNMFDERKVLTDFHGMSIEDFSASGDDFDLVDGFDVLPQQTRDLKNGRATETPMHKASSRTPDPEIQGLPDDVGRQLVDHKAAWQSGDYMDNLGNPDYDKLRASLPDTINAEDITDMELQYVMEMGGYDWKILEDFVNSKGKTRIPENIYSESLFTSPVDEDVLYTGYQSHRKLKSDAGMTVEEAQYLLDVHKKLSNDYFKDLPDEIIVYRRGPTDAASVGHTPYGKGIDSYSMSRQYDHEKMLPQRTGDGNPLKAYTVNKNDLLLPETQFGVSADEVEVLIKSDAVTEVGPVLGKKLKARSVASQGNTKVRVFGKTADATGDVGKMDEGLQAALRKDNKVHKGQTRGFGNPNVEKWTATKAWMRENGYGKLRLGDDSYLIVDEFIGGNMDDPMTRVWAPDGAKPMSSYGIDPYDAVTPDEVNEVIKYIVDKGAKMTRKELRAATKLEGASKVQATAIRSAATQAEEAKAAMAGVRPDFDELAKTNMLNGSKAKKFLQRLQSTTRRGGQTTTRALDNLLNVFQKQGIDVPNELRTALFEAHDANELQVIFSQWLAREGGGRALLRGGGGNAGFGRMSMRTGVKEARFPKLKLTDRTGVARRLAYGMPSDPLNMVEDPSNVYRVFDEILPNFNVERGSFVPRYDNNGKLVPGQLDKNGDIIPGTGIDVEGLFETLRNRVPNQRFGSFELMGEFAEMFFSSLVADGVDAKLARQAKKWWGDIAEDAVYEAERVAATNLRMGTDELAYVGDHQVHLAGPQVTAQLWDGAIHPPDPKVIRRIANESDLLGQISNRLTSKRFVDEDLLARHGNETLEDRAWYKFASYTMDQVWKPFVLLRAAWTIRIAIDDQARMAAEGYGALNHPFRLFQYAMTMPKDWLELFRKGQVDVFGTMMKADEVTDMAHGILYQKSLMKKADDKLGGAGTYGYRHTKTVGREDPEYIEGLTADMAQLRASTLTKTLANSKADDPVHEAVIWLQGKSTSAKRRASGLRERQELASLYSRSAMEGDEAGNTMNVYSRILQGSDYDLMYEVVSKQYATLHQKTGGLVYLDDGNGIMRNYGSLDRREGLPITGGAKDKKAKWVIEQDGDEELLRAIAGDNSLYGDFLNSDDAMKALKGALRRKVRTSDQFPVATRVADPTRTNNKKDLKQVWDGGVGKLMNFFMTTPSNTLSRSPLFHRAYWRKMTELYPYMDDSMKAQVRGVANKANVRIAEKAAKKADPAIAGQLTDMDQADGLAKAFGLTQVEETLFTLTTQRRNISQSLKIIMPFAEAWGEFISRWGRLLVYGDRNMANARRFQQGIEGARDSGFFYENEFGQEVFNYPAFLTKGTIGVHNTLNNMPGLGAALGPDVSQEATEALTQGQMFKPADAGVRQPSSVTGSVESMNFASGVIPGFGPVMQMASKAILPDDPDWDEVRTLISPFGQEGSVLGSLAPAWMKRIGASLGGGDDPQLNYQYSSAVQDIIRTQIDAGEWAGLTSPQQVNAKVKEAESEARGLLMVRAAATFFSPAAPSYRFQKQDESGMVWSYSNLGAEYRKIKDEQQGDESAAYEQFRAQFGMLPHPFIGGRSYGVVDRARTSEGYKFQRGNVELFDRYPGTAMYLDPMSDVGEYDHDATLRQLRLSEREAWTGEQMIYLQQDQLGDLSMDQVEDVAKGMSSVPEREAYVADNRAMIQERYPLWNKPIPGKRQTFTNEQQIEEVYSWLTDPTVAGTPVSDAARQYISMREAFLDRIRALGGKTLGSTSATTEQGILSNMGRQQLRALALELEQQTPQFGPLFRNVFQTEVRAELDLGETTRDLATDGAYGEDGDLFEQLLGAYANG